jgi:uncharacterized membrane protein YdjX (TVP38/TMEM64 family)
MKKTVVYLLVIVGFAFLALAIYYWATPAGSLPHFFPGYSAGSAHKHLKHGIAAIVLAFAAWIVAWFWSGKKPAASTSSQDKD